VRSCAQAKGRYDDTDLIKPGTDFNKKFPRGRCQAKWAAEFPINKRDVMRAELLVESSGRSTIDIRRWSATSKNPTRRGVAFGVELSPENSSKYG
jgi:hypothetical protein